MVLIQLLLGGPVVFLFLACDKDDKDSPQLNPLCSITGCMWQRMEGNRYEGILSDTMLEYTYAFTDSMLSSIESLDGNTRFEFTYQEDMVVKRTRFNGFGDMIHYDTFIYNDMNRLSKLERFDSLHASLYTYQALYAFEQAVYVYSNNTPTHQNRLYAFSYENGSLIGYTIDGDGRKATIDPSKENPITIQDLILSIHDINPIDFALVSSVHPVIYTVSYGVAQPVSSTEYRFRYEPTCYNLPLKEYSILNTIFEFSYTITQYSLKD